MRLAFILLSMLFLHILDDFVLQSFTLSSLKQKQFWQEKAPDKMYRRDYIVALIIHAFSWAFLIMLPIAIYENFNISILYTLLIIINTSVHAVVDDIKANKRRINLITDQTIHVVQIIASFFIYLPFLSKLN